MKHRSWQRYLETKSGEKYIEYRRLSNQVKKSTKKAKRNAEREIAKEAKTNPKKFWKCVSKKTKIRQGIPDLVYEDPEGNEHSTGTDGEKGGHHKHTNPTEEEVQTLAIQNNSQQREHQTETIAAENIQSPRPWQNASTPT